jgi:hypothetical protein
MLIYKDYYGIEVDKTGYDIEGGNVLYKNEKVGVFELESDSALGSYYLITLNNGKQFHDHYFEDKDIIKHIV